MGDIDKRFETLEGAGDDTFQYVRRHLAAVSGDRCLTVQLPCR
jgi:hypothetical protein